ncbi:hypothetical protein ABE237_22550 [Brevibacillus formosus]|uniref:hypothetical protein n=1 Tax=Brevibacillus formosus TaxID=54913 RepID=UPI001F54FAF3|nr:hypothetical protein [Brevibacillus formosus]MBG9941770.1 hypothetical protein [Brevibacillus formosus]
MRRLKLPLVIGLLLMSGCGANQTSNADSSEVEQLKKQVVELTEENKNLKSQLDSKSKNESAQQNNSDSTKVVSNNTISLNKPIVIPDFCEITLKKVTSTTRVNPPKPGDFYTYYEIKDQSNIFYDVVVDIKSLLPAGKASDEFVSVKLKYDNKYEYNSFSAIEKDNGKDFTYTNITSIEPLKKGTLHYIAELPVEATKDQKPLEVIITSNEKEYVYKIR